jgi:alpha-glucosidase (family GH31 glycosyl hydrolase)
MGRAPRGLRTARVGLRGTACLPGALAALALLAPGTASAAVSIGSERVVVRSDMGSAEIARRPLRLHFRDSRGRTVLSQVANNRPAPFFVPPAPRPVPLGSEPPRAPTLYSPLTFTVGTQTNVQYPAGQYVGNQLAGTESGIQYSAREVVGVERSGSGVRLDVSTSDPSGRRLIVTVAPDRGALRVSVRPSAPGGVATFSDSFSSAGGEAFRGFGGRHNSLDQRGQDFFNWVQQQNTGAGSLGPITEAAPGLTGGDRYLFPNGPQAAYYVRSDFISSRRYGFMLDRSELSRWRMASDRGDAWQVGVAAPGLDYLVAPGDGPRAIRTLTGISGRHRVPPRWAVGTQLDRLVKYPPEEPADHRAVVRQDLRDIERYRVPLDAYRIEGWQFFSRAELRDVIRMLRRRGIRPILYFRAFVGRDEIGTDSPRYYDEAVSRGYVARRSSGHPYIFVSNFSAPSALIDFTNPAAVSWWQRRIREALDLGADGFMQDFGEQVLVDMRFHNGETGATMHNRYPVLFHRATREVVERWEREHPRRGKVFFYTRSGYSGSPGSAAYETANFPGDETTDWSRSSGLASIATDMLNRGVGGALGFSTDIGGYFDIGPYQPTTRELFIRWTEWTVLSPVFRLHGSVGAGTHTPWSFDRETLDTYKRLSRLRLRASALVHRLWSEGAKTGMPIARPLWLAYPSDPRAARQDQQWLLGPDVLVAPVVTEGARSRSVYFPRGCWQSPETGAAFQGPRSTRVPAPLGHLPYFFRCGTDPFAEAAGRCLPRRMGLNERGVGRSIRVGRSRRALLGTRPRPVLRRRARLRWCVNRGGSVRAAFDRRGRALLVASTAPRHGARGVRRLTSFRTLRRRFGSLRRVAGGLYRAGPRSRRFFGVRRGRVRYVAVADRRLLRSPRALRRYVRRAALKRL